MAELFFTLVIPLYNKAAEIRRTIDSVLGQSFSDFEVIVVDDGSTDGGADIVASISDSRIRLIRKDNGGVCSARNRGIFEAKAEYVALLDADDTWDRDYLLEQKRMIEDFPQCAMWGINFAELYDGRLVHELATGLPSGYRGVVDNYFGIQGRVSDLFCSSSVMIRKSAFLETGYFDERLKYSEDIDMWWRIIAGFPVAFYDRYMAYYHYDAGNRAMNKRIDLKAWLAYYPEKYVKYKGNEPFYTFSQRWCAIKIKDFYFSDIRYKSIRKAIKKKFDFSVLPLRYRILFKMPYSIAKLVYRLKP